MAYHQKLSMWIVFMILSSFSIQVAAELTVVPDPVIVQVGDRINLSISGQNGEVTWMAGKGQILGSGNQVVYIAPAQADLDMVTVFDSAGNTKTVKVIITLEVNVSLENAQWEVFTNRQEITALLLSEDGKTLWVGTWGGLEQRDGETGELRRVFTKVDGLPGNGHNFISGLLNDGEGGLWIGFFNEGLVHYTTSGQWIRAMSFSGYAYVLPMLIDDNHNLWAVMGDKLTYYNVKDNQRVDIYKGNSALPFNHVVSGFSSDSKGGFWISGEESFDKKKFLYHYSANGQWEMVNIENIKFDPFGHYDLLSDDKGGVWIANNSARDLVHYEVNGQWTTFDQTNSKLSPNARIRGLFRDGNGGVWIDSQNNDETSLRQLIHYNADGQWTIIDPENSILPKYTSSVLPKYAGSFTFPVLSDNHGGIWIGTSRGLVHYHANGQWMVLNEGELGLPGNDVAALLTDGNHNLWIGTEEGLAHYDTNNKWTIFNSANSELTYNRITGLLSDKHNGLWVTTSGGLAHYNSSTKSIRKILLPSQIPINPGFTALSEDGQDGIWLATGEENSVVHYNANEQWEFFEIEDSSSASSWFYSYALSSSSDGVWIATSIGLVHYNNINKQWTVFNQDNSGLLGHNVNSLLNDGNGGLWIGTQEGLNHRTANGQWISFTRKNSGLPGYDSLFGFDITEVWSILHDESDGLWIGTEMGLAHYKTSNDQWVVFNSENSKLPDNNIRSLSNDGNGGVWVGTWGGGLAHLTFGHKTQLCTKIDQAQCQALLTGQRAAIIVAGGGAQDSNSLWDATERISNKLYSVLNKRGFDKNEIYYLSPKAWADFNGDGKDDQITRPPVQEGDLQIEDIQNALKWAQNKGSLQQPLYLFFIDHGGEGKLMLSKFVELKVTDFKALLDDYQASTGNQVILVIEACHSGSFLAPLAAPNRALMTSAKADELAYFVEKQGFTSFLTENLSKGMNFVEAFDRATQKQQHLSNQSPQLTAALGSERSTSQTPQFDDNHDGFYTSDDGEWLKQVYINGNFVTADLTLAVQSLTPSTVLQAGDSFTLIAKATTAVGNVQRVWAILKPPKMDFLLDIYGTPITAYPRIDLAPKQEENLWQTTWQESIYNGAYQLIFYVQDNEGNIASSDETLTLTVTGGIDPPEQATVTVQLNQTRYKKGEHLTATLTEDLNWGYDLYAAVVLPDGHFVSLKKTNEFKAFDTPVPWISLRTPARPLTLIDMTLPETLPSGNYCLYGILSPKDQPPLESQLYWKVAQQCFEISE